MNIENIKLSKNDFAEILDTAYNFSAHECNKLIVDGNKDDFSLGKKFVYDQICDLIGREIRNKNNV